jgi:hypothetical protein
MVANHPNSNLSVYIDDVGTRCAGARADVIKWTVAHAVAVKKTINEAGLRVSDDEGQVVAKQEGWRNKITALAAEEGVKLKSCRTLKN